MSERQEHRRRFAARWDYLNRLDAWLRREPSKWRLVQHLFRKNWTVRLKWG